MAWKMSLRLLCTGPLLLLPSLAALGQRAAGSCTRVASEREGAILSARGIAASTWAPGSRGGWTIVGADSSEIVAISDDKICSKLRRAIRAEYGTDPGVLAVARGRGTYVVHTVPSSDTTYIVDDQFRVLAMLIVPS
jgi:hypothetical protein